MAKPLFVFAFAVYYKNGKPDNLTNSGVKMG